MGVEIERKFLVAAWPPVALGAGSEIRQGYLAIEPGGTEVRVRHKDGRWLLGVKRGKGLVREEFEVELSADAFDTLWPATQGRRVEKVRHRLEAGGQTAELDVFTGDLAGLRLVEVEFPSTEEAADFTQPDWFGTEVTGLEQYLNQTLAFSGSPTGPCATEQ